MRRLLRISIEGFKTFSGRTDLTLGPGLTAIVGPNGSGKSNLIDAIAWAVGDRSWKSLRGDGMEDLLFHGDERCPAAPFAKVTLGFSNEDRLLGIDFSEVTVCREIRRGEGTRISLNGVEAKLKDVQTLLSGTGLVGGFSLIRQGTVDKFILGGPEDVGRWLEESANISAYRHRKQEAVDRLGKVEANAAEAERRSASLRRELPHVQGRAARVRSRRSLEERSLALRQLLAGWERCGIDAALSKLEKDDRHLRQALERLAEERRVAARRRSELEEELGSLGGEGESSSAGRCPLEIAEVALRIGKASEALLAIAGYLTRQGESAWEESRRQLADVAAGIGAILTPGARSARETSTLMGSRLGELRRLGAEEQRLEQDFRRHSTSLSEHQCDRARLEERRQALGGRAQDAGELPGDFHPQRTSGELEAVERELAAIGPVDETAEAREQEIVRELASLAPVLEDLESSRSKLGAFIRQLETYTRRIFEETRVGVESRFRKYCGILFEGGEATLSPVIRTQRSEEPLDSGPPGVEVRVKLPRKPELSLTLLSGGERSLAGIALVLALAAGEGEQGRLLILDEVDAALDEGNAVRLARLLRELQEQHQLLCVTHNKMTMLQASQLVGVTCAATAMSRLLKVRMETSDRGGSAA